MSETVSKYKRIGVKPMIGALGAEISGVALKDMMDEATFTEIKQAFLQFQVIVFRNQDINYQHQVDFAKRFGDLYIHPYVAPMEDCPDMIRLLKEPDDVVNNGGSWHFDLTFDHHPPMASILRLIDVPDTGGDTLFTSMYHAYDALSASMKSYLDGQLGVHTSTALFGPTGFYTMNKDNNSLSLRSSDEDFVTTHPLVRTNPDTGRKGLFINPGYVERILGVPERESAQLIEFLLQHCASAEFAMRLQWKKDTVTMWDNRCVMHYALNDYQGQRREGVRVTVAGDRPA